MRLGTSFFSIAIASTIIFDSALALAQSVPSSFAHIPIIRLWSGDAPATQPADRADTGEEVVRRGTAEHPSLSVMKISHPWLLPFNDKGSGALRPAIVVCPGGAYRFESMSDEGFDVAQKFDQNGFAAFVLKYRLPHGIAPASDALPAPQEDVLRAIQVIRSHAAEWHIDPKRVGIIGFSAGGHLAATAATMYQDAKLLPAHDDVSKLSAKPDFAILMYPVISMEPGVGHRGSHDNLIGKNADEILCKRFSTELHVTTDTPPLFVCHAKDDQTVPFWNAELIDQAAAKANIPHELVTFEHGGHGFGLGRRGETEKWFGKCIAWLKGLHVIDAQSN